MGRVCSHRREVSHGWPRPARRDLNLPDGTESGNPDAAAAYEGRWLTSQRISACLLIQRDVCLKGAHDLCAVVRFPKSTGRRPAPRRDTPWRQPVETDDREAPAGQATPVRSPSPAPAPGIGHSTDSRRRRSRSFRPATTAIWIGRPDSATARAFSKTFPMPSPPPITSTVGRSGDQPNCLRQKSFGEIGRAHV